MPNPILWGVAAALLNFVPYVDAIGGILMVGMVALISFDSIGYATIPPLLYIAFSIIEGQIRNTDLPRKTAGAQFRCNLHLCGPVGLALGYRGCNYCRAAACHRQGVLRPLRGIEFLRGVSLRAAVGNTG
jgi:hypothetical protein